MIRVINNAEALQFSREITQRPLRNGTQERLTQDVAAIISLVQEFGDDGLRELATRFGDPVRDSFKLKEKEIQQAIALVPDSTKTIIGTAEKRIRNFAQAVMDGIKPVRIDNSEFETGLDYRPIKRSACYVPAGRYPLPSTALMTAITAQVARVKEICIFSPRLAPEIIYAGSLAGVQEFYQIGGAQAIAAAAFGTPTIKPVDMIVGPGNAFVTEAKRQLQGIVGIDMLAGPSEICVIADDGADANLVALDLLSQAEHAPDAQAYLLTTSSMLAEAVQKALPIQIASLNLPSFIEESIAGSAIIVLDSLDSCCDLANKIAPEHLLLLLSKPEALSSNLINYGALFMGYGCTVPFGDYMAGPNHTLPTNQTARFQGCLSPLTFLRAQSWIKVRKSAPSLANQTASFASLEGLAAHKAAAFARSST